MADVQGVFCHCLPVLTTHLPAVNDKFSHHKHMFLFSQLIKELINHLFFMLGLLLKVCSRTEANFLDASFSNNFH